MSSAPLGTPAATVAVGGAPVSEILERLYDGRRQRDAIRGHVLIDRHCASIPRKANPFIS
jgi:hypothetical protein